jgi:uncharacterized heparinase superfamily protein
VSRLRLPGRHLVPAVLVGTARAVGEDWRASPPGRALIGAPRAEGFQVRPRDFRPADADDGRRILAGGFVLAGASLAVGVRGDPWDRPSPSLAFAEALHRFDWLPGLLATGPDGAAEALRLALDWRRVFGRWNAFSWAPAIMARRVFNLACAAPTLAARASEAETAQLASDLLRQGRALLATGDAADAAERMAATAVAAAALRGPAARRLLDRALGKLARALPATVDADGGHRTRRPDLALELLFDLQTLEEALGQRGLAGPDALPRALDRLAAAVRFFTLADGTLAAFHGGQPLTPSYVAAARAQDETGDRPTATGLSGYQRMDGRTLQVMADVAGPPTGVWACAARAHPLSLEVLAGGRRLIEPGVGRSIESGSTVQVGEGTFGHALSGFPGAALGPRLVDADLAVEAQRHEAPGAVWLDLAHHGWMARYGVMHQRRLYLDTTAGELRGEDRLTPTAKAQGPDGRHFIGYALRFQLASGVSVLVSQDRRSVLLRREGEAGGWVLRNDALDIAVEPSPRTGRPGQQLVLRGQRRADSGARVRWKLAPAAH